uniref:Uncharacterized protein n=1 Tax=Thermosporothrix sp. COM3 TaxID=2490863 RepID=A0A455SWI2_9CHLR|nr:hypothetical protein KTC_42350 [Thermosporothrix sp. COM3]
MDVCSLEQAAKNSSAYEKRQNQRCERITAVLYNGQQGEGKASTSTDEPASGMGDKARLPAPFCDCSVFDIEDILYFCYRKSGNLPDQSMIEESEVKVNE